MSKRDREPETRERKQPRAPLPPYRRRRRALVFVVVLVFVAGVGGMIVDVNRMFAGATTPTVDLLGRPGSPVFAFEVAGAEDEPLQRPVSVAVTDERIYVTDSLAGYVAVFRHSGDADEYIGQGRLQVPVYVTVDPDRDELFVSDRALSAVLAFSTVDGSFIETITPTIMRSVEVTPSVEATGAASANETETPSANTTGMPSVDTTSTPALEETRTPFAWVPIAVETADDGSLFVSDVAGVHRVWHIRRDGTVIDAVPDPDERSPAVTLDFPNAMKAIGSRLWVSDSNSRRLLEFGEGGTLVRSLQLGRLVRGFDVVLAEEGDPVYFALVDAFSHEVVLVSETGSEVARYGEPGSGPGQFSFPNDIAVHEGVTWVADTGNARIQAWEWGESARVAAAAVWPGGPSWLGLASGMMLASPLALLLLLRRVRAAVSPEAVPMLSAVGATVQRWGRVRLLVPDAGDEPVVAPTLPPIDARPVSPSDVAYISQVYSLDTEQAEVLSIALRVRMLVTEDETLATVARARAVEVYGPSGFAAEFAVAGAGASRGEEDGVGR